MPKKHRAVVKVLSPKREDKPIAPLIRGVLDAIGEDPNREGLERTPERVERALHFLTQGE